MITIEWMSSNWDVFNAKYFNSSLEKGSFIIKKTKRTLGSYNWVKNRIMISIYYNRSENDFLNTLLHEMIHQYIRQNDLEPKRVHHGKVFYSIANRVNKDGWNITRCGDSSGCGLNPTNSGSVTYNVIAYETYGYCFQFVAHENYVSSFLSRLKNNYHVNRVVSFKSNDDITFANYTKCRSRVIGHKISQEQFNKYLYDSVA